jgi:hypothetical protein
MTLVLVALVFWSGADSGRVWLGWAAAGGLIAIGSWLEMRSEAMRDFGRIVLAGGLATLYGVTYAAHQHGSVGWLRPSWLAVLALAFIAAGIARSAGRRASPKLAAVGFALAGLCAALQPFTLFYFASAIVLAAAAGWFIVRYGGAIVAWITLPILYAGFLIWWPYSDGRVDADRYLALGEYRTALAACAVVWALFAWNSALAKFPSGRLGFVTLNNALFYALGVFVVPPAFPERHWKFTVAFGVMLLVAGALTRSSAEVRRGYLVQGGLLVVLGGVAALTGREAAALLAIGSAFCVLTVARREQWLLRDLAFATALLAAVCVGIAIREPTPHALRLGALIGAVLLFCACWIDDHREPWNRWAVAIFTALGLGVWLLTTLHFTPERLRAPVLAIEAALLTASFGTLGVREIPWLAKAFSFGALLVWFMQLEAFVRPWWHPLVLVAATLGVSAWWQTRGRSILPAWELHWVQGVAAAASATILLLHVESCVGRQPGALIAMSALAVAGLLLALALRDRWLAAFSQLFTIAAVGEFIGQHTGAPLPGRFAALAPIVALPAMAPIVRKIFADTEWERPVRWVAALYGALAGALFVAWALHHVPAPNSFLVLAIAAMLLLLWTAVAHPRGPLLASLLCSTGALLAYWLGWIGIDGFRWRDLFAFILLLGFGVLGRRTQVLPEPVRQLGIVLGLGSVVHWVTLWMGHHYSAVPVAIVWAVMSVIVFGLGWWLDEPLYRGLAWALLAGALVHMFWIDRLAGAPLRAGLFAIGAAALAAAFSYARRPAPAGK